MPYKIKTFRTKCSDEFDTELNQFIADKNIKVHNITFCSVPDTYIAHIAYSIIEEELVVTEYQYQ